ncbi:hypothetical protein [Sorangium sp. So ce693]|uniref:hypothetical protein n=1 Tax=Sorangium sp. So ce693 TaxID=3133318 RepID=UPI003F6464FD
MRAPVFAAFAACLAFAELAAFAVTHAPATEVGEHLKRARRRRSRSCERARDAHTSTARIAEGVQPAGPHDRVRSGKLVAIGAFLVEQKFPRKRESDT